MVCKGENVSDLPLNKMVFLNNSLSLIFSDMTKVFVLILQVSNR